MFGYNTAYLNFMHKEIFEINWKWKRLNDDMLPVYSPSERVPLKEMFEDVLPKKTRRENNKSENKQT